MIVTGIFTKTTLLQSPKSSDDNQVPVNVEEDLLARGYKKNYQSFNPKARVYFEMLQDLFQQPAFFYEQPDAYVIVFPNLPPTCNDDLLQEKLSRTSLQDPMMASGKIKSMVPNHPDYYAVFIEKSKED